MNNTFNKYFPSEIARIFNVASPQAVEYAFKRSNSNTVFKAICMQPMHTNARALHVLLFVVVVFQTVSNETIARTYQP